MERTALRSQTVILENPGKGNYSKYNPYAFTEHGITMTSRLKIERARREAWLFNNVQKYDGLGFSSQYWINMTFTNGSAQAGRGPRIGLVFPGRSDQIQL